MWKYTAISHELFPLPDWHLYLDRLRNQAFSLWQYGLTVKTQKKKVDFIGHSKYSTRKMGAEKKEGERKYRESSSLELLLVPRAECLF